MTFDILDTCSFFLSFSILHSVMSDHHDRYGRGTYVSKKKKKKQGKNNNTNLTKPPQLKLFTRSHQGQAYQAMSLPNPRSLYFGLKPINCLRRDSFGCKAIPSCNCPGEERKFQPVRICTLSVILKGLGSGTPVTSSLRQVPVLASFQ